MRLYVTSTRLFAIIAIIFSVSCLFLHYKVNGTESEFWCNVSLTLAGSGLVGLMTSLIGYFDERRKTLESLYIHAQALIRKLNAYNYEWAQEDKIKFVLEFGACDTLVDELDKDYGNICFLLDFAGSSRKYIYNKIYYKLSCVSRLIISCERDFKGYMNNEGISHEEISYLIIKIEFYLVTVYTDELMKPNVTFPEEIRKELNEHYYVIMYGKKASRC